MNKETNDVREQLRAYLTKTGATQSEVAKRIGTSSALISSYLSGTYKGDVNKLERLLQEFLIPGRQNFTGLLE